MHKIAALAIISLMFPMAEAFAQDLDEDQGSSRRRARDVETEIIREVERGYFMKANFGSQQYIGTFNGLVVPVVASSLALGSDFIDRENSSIAWEIALTQTLQNGPKEDELGVLPPGIQIQGDVHTFAGTLMLEYSGYLSRRFGLGIRAGGGVMVMPLLMHPQAYEETIIPLWGAPSPLHEGPLPLAGGGPTIEYYTKLSHFSLGVDVDVLYVIGFDLGIAPSGYLKYTF